MTFTYSGTAITSDLERVRLELGDTIEAQALFTDEEVQVKLDESEDVVIATASLCDILARRFARAFDFAEDGQSFSRSQMSKAYAQLARDLRQRSALGFKTLPTTRTDGYSDDIDYSESEATSGKGRVRIGYTSPDLPS